MADRYLPEDFGQRGAHNPASWDRFRQSGEAAGRFGIAHQAEQNKPHNLLDYQLLNLEFLTVKGCQVENYQNVPK